MACAVHHHRQGLERSRSTGMNKRLTARALPFDTIGVRSSSSFPYPDVMLHYSITTPFKFSSGSGYFIFNPSSVSTNTEEITRSRNHLRLAGTMYHGATSVLVLLNTSS